jgi:hypothetical protein
MRATDGIDTHGLEFGEFAMQGILIEGCTQTTKVVVLTDTIELEVLAIQPEACLGIELKVAETCGGLDFVNDLAGYYKLRSHLVDVGGFERPLMYFTIGQFTIGRLFAFGI